MKLRKLPRLKTSSITNLISEDHFLVEVNEDGAIVGEEVVKHDEPPAQRFDVSPARAEMVFREA